MKVRVSLYGRLRRYLPPDMSGISVDVSLPEGATVADLMKLPWLPPEFRLLVLVNGSHRPMDAQLAPGDEVVLAPMLSGG